MQQRRLRLGDVLDDYCPRERRLTNHAVVAMIEDQIKQTRCLTCDAEHEYKEAKVPARRRKAERTSALAGPAPVKLQSPASDAPVEEPEEPNGGPSGVPATGPAAGAEAGDDAPASDGAEEHVHRPLIRATLPRTEGQVPTRQIPEFTIRSIGTNGRRGPASAARGRSGGDLSHGAGRGQGRQGGWCLGNWSGNAHARQGQQGRRGKKRSR